jgi:hypothetical protein
MIRYKSTQLGWVTIGIILIIASILLVTSFNNVSSYKELKLLIAFLVLVLLLLFHSLTTIVTDRYLKVYFGIGLIRKVIPLDQIQHCEIKKNQCVFGWGIRIGTGFILWNVSGLNSVELTLKNRKWKFRVGTDKPEELRDAIVSAIMAQQL